MFLAVSTDIQVQQRFVAFLFWCFVRGVCQKHEVRFNIKDAVSNGSSFLECIVSKIHFFLSFESDCLAWCINLAVKEIR